MLRLPRLPPRQFGFASGGTVHLRVDLFDVNGVVLNPTSGGNASSSVYFLGCEARAVTPHPGKGFRPPTAPARLGAPTLAYAPN